VKNPRLPSVLILLALASSVLPRPSAAEEVPGGTNLRADAARIEQRILELARFGANPEGGVSRVAFSDADIEGRRYVVSLMEEAGLDVRIDEAGNILGRRVGASDGLPPILFGSHIDSVPEGGNYDGDVGVMAAIECAQVLGDAGVTTRHPLEVVVFADEEGGLVGSRGMLGGLSPEALEIVSHSGKTIRQGLRDIGGDPDHLERAVRHPGEIAAYLELHIEQGAILHSDGIEIGIVQGIVGIQWWDVTLEGSANHAGTTPMDRRRDALLAAARLITAVNEVATGVPGRQVGTVGRIRAEPGAPNVIPGRVVLSLELRDLSMDKIESLYDRITERARAIEAESGVKITFTPLDVTSTAAPTDERIRRLIEVSAKDLGLSHRHMPSGAGHDAQEMARIAPVGMIFVPSVDGISHSPKELTRPADMANGADVLLQTILRIDGGALE
jgi:N-carbamoyl-L-amino-acid hydrolase